MTVPPRFSPRDARRATIFVSRADREVTVDILRVFFDFFAQKSAPPKFAPVISTNLNT